VSRLGPGDLRTRDQVALLGGDLTPSQVLVHPTSGDLYVVARAYKGDVPTGPTGPNLKISADPEHAAAGGTSAITAFDSVLRTPKGRLELPFAGAYAGAFSKDGKELYVACRGADRVAVIGLAPLRVLRAYAVAPGPAGIALADPDTLVVASFNTDPGIVQFVDRKSGQIRQVLKVPANPAALAVHPTTGQVYVGCAGADVVLELDPRTRTVVRTLPVGAHPSGLAVVD
jgi:YVTN family beta-propeller protein